MANNVSQYNPLRSVVDIDVEGVIDVTGPLIGRSIIDALWRRFSPRGQIEEGDYLMDRSRVLLRRHLQLMEVDEQDAIRKNFDNVRNIKNGLENFSGSRFQKLREAREYRRRSQVTYRIVKKASQRGIEGSLMDQIAEAVQQQRGGSGSGPGTGSVARNPFTDSHAISTLTDVSVVDLDRVNMSTYQAGDTGEAAVVLDLVAQDQSVQHIVATFPTEVFSGVRTNNEASSSHSIAPEAPAAISLHQDDDTMPRFVVASLPDISQDQRANEGETRSFISVTSTEGVVLLGTSENISFYPEEPPH